ncbi:FliH/SctL family protein [Paenibacillus crassostreae]|uniref:Flagellar assembly protein FliH n=1 Tax=Paenibacillus crassostreae TaxID=1763538 RepID=A0A167FNM1_9BACL|nr:FliH/SctL family protein [Paenibacillus crassostreae]AOZ94219.1 flagellar assembly protein FliH [Paenibacillus crassostreae]OAB76745.1 flagellar assembly protein FliH [Paenibacillus crassostreae]
MSNLIKHSQYRPVEVLKELDLSKRYNSLEEEVTIEENVEEEQEIIIQIDEEAERLKNEMLQDAKEFAEQQIRESSIESERILAEATEQIDQWWVERRDQDEHLIEAIKSEGFEQGFSEGRIKAEEELQLKIEEMMVEAQTVLEEAYRVKSQIIQEAEPFLVELSTAIAEKVIDKQLSIESNYMIDLIKKNLLRKREQGVITLCVAPVHFEFIQAAREELVLAIDSQAELKIIPDATVLDGGCVIRSSFGSIDARIDTQLVEIKKELIRIALDHEDRRDQDESA